jgi:two-component system, NarL family, nitrate/nitrite response regulator NarL
MHRPTRPPVRPHRDRETPSTESTPQIDGEIDEKDRMPALRPPRVAAVKASLIPSSRSEPAERIRILIADGKPASRQEFRRLLESQPDFSIVGDVVDGVEAVRLAFAEQPDILLLDFAVPEVSGLEVLRAIQRASLAVRTILLSGDIDQRTMVETLLLGARGLLAWTTPGELVCKSIRKVNRGQLWIGRETMGEVVKALAAHTRQLPARADFGLTRREREILMLVVEGDTNKGIARRLSVGEDTVKHHLTSIFNKTGVSTRLELALFALHFHLVESSRY